MDELEIRDLGLVPDFDPDTGELVGFYQTFLLVKGVYRKVIKVTPELAQDSNVDLDTFLKKAGDRMPE